MITRSLVDKIASYMEGFPAVGLIGPRQAGKTTLARTIAPNKETVYLDLEKNSDLAKLANPEAYLLSQTNKLVIIDEVQRMPELFPLLRSLIDERIHQGDTHAQFLLLGSASVTLVNQSSETLAGRIAYIELPPFHLLEIGTENMELLWLRGGFPKSFLAKSNAKSQNWRTQFVRTYLERDIPLLGPKIPATTLQRFWTMLAHNQGQLLNASRLASSLGVSSNTVANYLDLMVDLLLVRRLPPYHANTGKRLVKSPKIYVRDSGITHSLLRIGDTEQLLGHPVAGPSWEGFVIENLLAVAPENTAASFYRTATGVEIDLILELPGGKIWAIEIKRGLQPKLEKGFYIALEDVKPDKTFVLYPGKEVYPKDKNITVVSLEYLMKTLNGLAEI